MFAAVAAILAMIGLYGVLATTVRQRRTEIGVRMAFGATQGRILSLIIGQGLALSVAGIVVGVLAAIALTRVMATLLVGVTATDPSDLRHDGDRVRPGRRVRGLDSSAACRRAESECGFTRRMSTTVL